MLKTKTRDQMTPCIFDSPWEIVFYLLNSSNVQSMKMVVVIAAQPLGQRKGHAQDSAWLLLSADPSPLFLLLDLIYFPKCAL